MPDDGDSIDLFEAEVALSSDTSTALIGVRVDEDPHGDETGSAYVFERADGTWSQLAKLTPGDGGSHVFGRSAALAGEIVLVGSVAEEA